MPTATQRVDPFGRIEDRDALWTEKLAPEGIVPTLHGLRLDRAPFRIALAPGSARTAIRVHAEPSLRAADAFVAHVFGAGRTARDQRIAHHAVASDRQRLRIDEEPEIGRRADKELDQVCGLWRRRKLVFAFLPASPLELDLPIALRLRKARYGVRDQRNRGETLQARSSASELRVCGPICTLT